MLLSWIAGTFGAALLMTVITERFALRFGVLSKGSFRRKISEGTPLLGGIGIVLAAAPGLVHFSPDLGSRLLMSAIPILVLGAVDDIWEIGGRWKLSAQVLSAVLWVALTPANDFLLQQTLNINLLNLFITTAWIIGLTNAFNLIDGLDGQASTLAIINWTALAAVTSERGLSLVMVAAIAGFLMRNFSPARIYLGEVGSSFLGFSLAAITSLATPQVIRPGGLIGLVFLFAVPLFDTVSAMVRRFRRGTSLFTGDREHLHHRLTKLQFSTVQTLTVMGVLTFAGSMTFVLAVGLGSQRTEAGLYLTSASLMFLCLFGMQFCEKHFTQRVLGLGRGLLSKHLSARQRSPLGLPPRRSIVIDLLPAFRELQMQGIMTLHDFLRDFAGVLQKHVGEGRVQFLSSYSVAVLLADKESWSQEDILAFAQPCHELFRNYHCLSSSKEIPECLTFCNSADTKNLLPLLDVELVEATRPIAA